MTYEVNVGQLEKQAKAISRNASRVLDPDQRERMKEMARNYQRFVKQARAGVVPTRFNSESDFYKVIESLTEADERIPAARVSQSKTPNEWISDREAAIRAILDETRNLRGYDPDGLERLSLSPNLAGRPTGKAYALLAEEMRAGRIPTRLPNGKALALARLLVLNAKHPPGNA